MQEAPALPLLNKSCLFQPLPKDLKNPNGRYLQCPATGQVYCMSTGSIYQNSSQIDPLPSNISSSKTKFHSFPYSPSLLTEKTSLNTRSSDEPVDGDGALTAPSIKRDKNNVTKADQCVKDYRPLITQSQKAEKHMQGVSTIPINQSNRIPKTKNEDQPNLDSTVSTTSSNVKGSLKTATKKHKNRKKKEKKTDKPITLIIKKSSNAENYYLRPVTKKRRKRHNNPAYNPAIKSKKKSFRYCITNLKPITEPTEPLKIPLNHLLFPQSAPPLISVKKNQRANTKFTSCSSITIVNKCCSKPAAKPPLYLSREDHEMIDLDKGFRKKTAQRKAPVKKFDSFNRIWTIMKPFNRKPHHRYKKKRRSLPGRYRNCIMASSVHEIIHSRFAKNPNEHMPESQIRALLSCGVRKLRKRQRWVRLMEEEAIEKYKNMILVKNKQKLDVEHYDVLHHEEKSWLVSYGRWVINRKNNESWPLLVKCLHKYPDSTLREACKHRSFCLRWNGTSYTLRVDHAYYTQIQCHMAVTDTSFAELVVHTHKETTVLPIYFDIDFWKKTEAKLETFFTTNILPFLKKVKYFSYLKKQPRLKNIRIIGISESYTTDSLRDLVSKRIPEMLCLKYNVKVERIYRIGVRKERKNKTYSRPRPVIARLRNVNDKKELIRAWRKQNEFKLGGNRIFIFPNYPDEVRDKRKAFSSCCSILIRKQIKFSLLYPATLKLYHENGTVDTFDDPKKAMKFIEEEYDLFDF